MRASLNKAQHSRVPFATSTDLWTLGCTGNDLKYEYWVYLLLICMGSFSSMHCCRCRFLPAFILLL